MLLERRLGDEIGNGDCNGVGEFDPLLALCHLSATGAAHDRKRTSSAIEVQWQVRKDPLGRVWGREREGWIFWRMMEDLEDPWGCLVSLGVLGMSPARSRRYYLKLAGRSLGCTWELLWGLRRSLELQGSLFLPPTYESIGS